MKKSIVVSVVAFFGLILTGCPNQQVIDGRDQIPNVEKACDVQMDINVYETEVYVSKSLSYDEVEALRRQVTQVSILFYQGQELWYSFLLDVVDGDASALLINIEGGQYDINVLARSAAGEILFLGNTITDVLPGVTNHPFIVLYLSQELNSENGDVDLDVYWDHQYYHLIMVATDGGSYLRTPEPENSSLGYSHGQNVTLTAVPLQGWVFESWEWIYADPQTLPVDLSVNPITITMNGDVTVRAIFRGLNSYVVDNDGQKYHSIQEAVDSTSGSLQLHIGEGDYDGFSVTTSRYVSVTGLGAGKSRICDFNPDRPHTIWVSPWEPVKEVDASKGGGPSLILNNLCVHNGVDKRNEYYSDAAVVVEGVGLVMNDCLVISESNSCVVTNYDSFASILHCDLIGPAFFSDTWTGSTKGITTYNEQNVQIFDSIIIGVNMAFHCSNGDLTTGYNCVDSVGGLWLCDRDQSFELNTVGFVFADPKFISDFNLSLTSPCIGMASDGYDIGIVFD